MGELLGGPGFKMCSRPACRYPAVARVGFHYEGRVAWITDLPSAEEPAAYDLCAGHADRLKVPRGWELDDSRRLPDPPLGKDARIPGDAQEKPPNLSEAAAEEGLTRAAEALD